MSSSLANGYKTWVSQLITTLRAEDLADQIGLCTGSKTYGDKRFKVVINVSPELQAQLRSVLACFISLGGSICHEKIMPCMFLLRGD